MYFDIMLLFILVWNLVSHIKEQTQIEDFEILWALNVMACSVVRELLKF
jgi:hypothetical protein